MAIAFDTFASDGDFAAAVVSCNITVGSLTNGILILAVSRVATNAITLNTPTVGGSTTGVTLLGSANDLSGDSLSVLDVYYKLAPSSGSTAVAATTTGTPSRIGIATVTYQGVAQSSTFGTPVTAGGFSSENPSAVVTTTAGNIVLDFLAWDAAQGTMTVGASQTQRVNNGVIEAAGSAISEETATGASTTMSWTRSAGDVWAQLAVIMNPAGAGAYTLTPVDAGSYTLTGAVVGVTFDSATTWLRVGR